MLSTALFKRDASHYRTLPSLRGIAGRESGVDCLLNEAAIAREIEVILTPKLASYLTLPIFIVDPDGILLF